MRQSRQSRQTSASSRAELAPHELPLVAVSGHRLPAPLIGAGSDQRETAIFSDRIPELPDGDLELRVRHRMQRKVILEGPDPKPYEGIIHEAALRVRVSDRAASRAQLASLLEASEAGNVTVRVVPFDLDGFGGSWAAMMLAGGAVPRLDTAVGDAPHAAAFVDSEAQLGVFRTLFRRVEGMSLGPERSRDFINGLAKEL